MDVDKVLQEIWKKYKWTILLAFVGLIFAVSVITYGFFKALFIFACMAVCVYFGLKLDRRAQNKRKAEDPFYHE